MQLGTLSKKTDIERVMKKGRSVRDRFCGFRFSPNDLGKTRIAFLIGVKTDKRAVVRNRLRRQYREVVYALIPAPGPSVDILFFPGTTSITLSYEERVENLRRALVSAGIIAT